MKNYYLVILGLFILNSNYLSGSPLEEMHESSIIKDSIENENITDAEYFEKIYFNKELYVFGNKALAGETDMFANISDKPGNSYKSPNEKYRNANFFYTLMPIYQSNGTIGLEMGELNLRGIGWFGSLKANLGVTKAASPYEEIDHNNINKDEYDLGAASLSLGITKSLLYPLYLYVGGGVAYHKYYYKDSDDDVIAVNLNGESGYYLFPETALGVQFGSVAIKGGAAYIDEEVYFNVGIGFGG